MKRTVLTLTAGACLLASSVTFSASCRPLHWKPGDVLTVNSSLHHGTRIEFPADLVTDAVPANKALWDVDSAANQVMIKPNSMEEEGKSTIIRAFTVDGNAYDIHATRSEPRRQDICVTIRTDGKFFSNGARSALQNLSSRSGDGAAVMAVQNATLQRQFAEQKQSFEQEKREAVYEALRRFRYHVYTRYDWDEGSGFSTENIVSDVYDDGRFTYIRLTTPNRGLLSVESVVGEKTAIVPYRYDDAYNMYQINGIYPEFTLRLDEEAIQVRRANNKTSGEF